MELDWILITGIISILLAARIIRWPYIEARRGLQIALYIIGGVLILIAAAYQYHIIPETSNTTP